MISDTIKLIDPPVIDRDALLKICERRLSQTAAGDHIDILNKPRCKLKNKVCCGTKRNTSERDQLEEDLRSILMNKCPRQYGEMPKESRIGAYQRLAPGTTSYIHIMKMKKICCGLPKNLQ